VIALTLGPFIAATVKRVSFSRLVSPGLRAGLLVAVGSALLSVPFALGLSMAAIATGVALFFFMVGLVQLTLSAVTRYSAGPATPSFLQ